MILVCLVLLALSLLWGKIKSTGGVGWLFLPNLFPPLPMKCSYMAINMKMIVSYGLNSWKEGKRKKKEEGYAFCKFTFSGLSRFNQMKKTLFKKRNRLVKSIERASPGFSSVLVNHFHQGDGNG